MLIFLSLPSETTQQLSLGECSAYTPQKVPQKAGSWSITSILLSSIYPNPGKSTEITAFLTQKNKLFANLQGTPQRLDQRASTSCSFQPSRNKVRMFLGRFCRISGVTPPPPFCFLNEPSLYPVSHCADFPGKISGNPIEFLEFRNTSSLKSAKNP